MDARCVNDDDDDDDEEGRANSLLQRGTKRLHENSLGARTVFHILARAACAKVHLYSSCTTIYTHTAAGASRVVVRDGKLKYDQSSAARASITTRRRWRRRQAKLALSRELLMISAPHIHTRVYQSDSFSGGGGGGGYSLECAHNPIYNTLFAQICI